MSDLYDSLEDECDGNTIKIMDSSDEGPVNNFNQDSPSPKKYSFYLKNNSDEDRLDRTNFNKLLFNDRQKKHLLPIVRSGTGLRDTKSVQNLTLNKKILNEHGLQLNTDGSITKSPRWNEELPFVTKEYKKLQFQQKKIFGDSKKVSSFIIQKKIKGETNMDSSPWRRRSSENLPSSSNFLKEDKETPSQYNMTDSMKEKFFLNKKNNSTKTSIEKNFRKSKSGPISSEACEILRKKGNLGDQFRNFRCAHYNSNFSESAQKQIKTPKSKIHGYVSNISLPTLRPKLNYAERHKIENNYNFCNVKHFNKKLETDTNRSNFGDSVVEELPEVESMPGTCTASAREDEELFYKKLIEKDKLFKRQAHHSARSEGPVYVGKLKSVLEERKNIFKCRNVSSAMKIDLDVEVDNLVNSFKNSPHFCCDNSSTKATKVELALKGKTYGYLANARNIFRLKAQSEKKQQSIDKEENLKETSNLSQTPKKAKEVSQRVHSSLGSKTTSPSIGIFPNVKPGLPRYLDKSLRPTKALSKTQLNLRSCDNHKKLVLPEVGSQKDSYTKIQNV